MDIQFLHRFRDDKTLYWKGGSISQFEIREMDKPIRHCINNITKAENKSTTFDIDITPIECSLSELGSIELKQVTHTAFESLWNYLVSEHHYLGHERIIGRRLKYLAFSKGRPIAALGWKSASLKIEARDCYIGWSEEQRKNNLKHVLNNNRFLILDWIRVPNLASHLLSKNIRVLSKDWYHRYGDRVLLLETFIDPARYRGSCYKAANWKYAGTTKGFTIDGSEYKYHGSIKEVYIYELVPEFRTIINCQSCPFPRRRRESEKENKTIAMMIQQFDYDPALISWADITPDLIGGLASELISFHRDFKDSFYRTEQRILGICYLTGLLSNIERKNVEAIALKYLGPERVRSLQMFMTSFRWDEDLLLRRHQELLSELIASDDAMITVDSSECPKKGKESVGVAHQYCGNLGKVANCQSGVFIGYTSSKGYGLLGRQLYMPEIWFTDEYIERREKCQVPEDLRFMTKIEIARSLIKQVRETGLFPAQWIGADATFGNDYKFRDEIESEGLFFFVNIRKDTLVWLTRPEVCMPPYSGKGQPPQKVRASHDPIRVSRIIDNDNLEWKTVILAEGSKGPNIAQICRLRIIEHRDELPGKELWLFVRKDNDGTTRYAFCNAPADIPLEETIRVSTMRWPIEQNFEEGKKHLGMDHYEHRSWPGWHRHMTYVFLALLFLLRIQNKYKKKSLR